ncbi:MAG: hypothetical protein BroJett025_05000 [Patescibacteria group bacterium]|nr:MAG: hypothetical protein BroJett025_05000 [Patescibacteria group bacterium]
MKSIFKKLVYYSKLVLSEGIFFFITDRKIVCQKFGNSGASWWIPRNILNENSICYSGGVGEDVSFDLELIKKFNVKVFAFDPTPRSIEYVSKNVKDDRFIFIPFGLWKNSTKKKFFTPANKNHVSHSIVNLHKTNEFFEANCVTLKLIMQKLKHSKIDLLKIDIEGAEYAVLKKMLNDKIYPNIICVEFDQPASLKRMYSMVKKLTGSGYKLVKKEYYNFTFIKK